jgi:hypothetical protein
VGAANSLLSKVEGEALEAARYSGSQGSPEIQARYEQRRQATIAATEEVERQIQAVDPGAEGPLVKAAVSNLTQRLAALPDHRATVLQRSTNGVSANEPYQQVAAGITETMGQIANSLDESVLYQRMSSATSVAALGAARSQVANLLAVAIEVGYYPATPPKQGETPTRGLRTLSEGCGEGPVGARAGECPIYEEIQEARQEFDTAADRFQAAGSANDVPSVRAKSDDSPLNDLITTAYEQGGQRNDLTPDAIGATAAEFAEAANRAIDGYDASVRYILLDADNADSAASIAQARADQAEQEARWFLVATVLAILVAAIVTYFVGRSITKGTRSESREVETAAP